MPTGTVSDGSGRISAVQYHQGCIETEGDQLYVQCMLLWRREFNLQWEAGNENTGRSGKVNAQMFTACQERGRRELKSPGCIDRNVCMCVNSSRT